MICETHKWMLILNIFKKTMINQMFNTFIQYLKPWLECKFTKIFSLMPRERLCCQGFVKWIIKIMLYSQINNRQSEREMVKYFLKRDWFNPISILFLLIILALAYLPKIHLLGFYRDDWYLLYAGNVLGPQSFYDVFLSDRPFRGFLMSAAFNLFGNNIL